jgi:hypothetical protein
VYPVSCQHQVGLRWEPMWCVSAVRGVVRESPVRVPGDTSWGPGPSRKCLIAVGGGREQEAATERQVVSTSLPVRSDGWGVRPTRRTLATLGVELAVTGRSLLAATGPVLMADTGGSVASGY